MSDTSTGLQENVAGLLCYVLGWISGIVFLILEPNRPHQPPQEAVGLALGTRTSLPKGAGKTNTQDGIQANNTK